jgi:hypothetical protein
VRQRRVICEAAGGPTPVEHGEGENLGDAADPAELEEPVAMSDPDTGPLPDVAGFLARYFPAQAPHTQEATVAAAALAFGLMSYLDGTLAEADDVAVDELRAVTDELHATLIAMSRLARHLATHTERLASDEQLRHTGSDERTPHRSGRVASRQAVAAGEALARAARKMAPAEKQLAAAQTDLAHLHRGGEQQ